MFKAINKKTGEVREFGYLQDLLPVRGEFTAGDDIDKAAEALDRKQPEEFFMSEPQAVAAGS